MVNFKSKSHTSDELFSVLAVLDYFPASQHCHCPKSLEIEMLLPAVKSIDNHYKR